MLNLITLDFYSTPIRIFVAKGNKVFFCAKDIYTAFGFNNARKAIKDHLNEDCKVIKLFVEDSSGKRQRTNFVDELGVEAFIVKTKADNADELKQWLDSTVKSNVEKIREDRRKKNTQAILKILYPTYKFGFEDKVGVKNQKLGENLGELYSIITSRHKQLKEECSTMYTPTELGKLIGTSGRYVNILLTKLKYQVRIGNRHKLTLLGQSKGGSYAVTSIKKGSNTPVGIIKWPESVLEDLKKCMFEAE